MTSHSCRFQLTMKTPQTSKLSKYQIVAELVLVIFIKAAKARYSVKIFISPDIFTLLTSQARVEGARFLINDRNIADISWNTEPPTQDQHLRFVVCQNVEMKLNQCSSLTTTLSWSMSQSCPSLYPKLSSLISYFCSYETAVRTHIFWDVDEVIQLKS